MPKTAQIEVFESPKSKPSQRWWWRVRAANGKIKYGSVEGFSRRAKAKASIKKFQAEAATLPIVEVGK